MGKKLTQEEFIKKVIDKRGDTLDLSEVVYLRTRDHVKLTCNKHLFTYEQKASSTLAGLNGCKFCYSEVLSEVGSKPKNFYLDQLNKVFKGKYEIEKVIINSGDNIEVFCESHGYFKKDFTSLKRGHGCPTCIKFTKKSGTKKDTESFIFLSKDTHKDWFNYSNTNYVDSKTKVNLTCNRCGYNFDQLPRINLSGKGCPNCWTHRNRLPKYNSRNTLEDIEERCKVFFEDTLDFSNSESKTSNEKITVFCKKCNNNFDQYTGHLIRGVGCQICSRSEKQSKPEKLIESILKENNIKYECEKSFEGCSHKNKLRFDFYLPELNTCIEYQGEQHYNPISIFGGEDALKKQIIKDQVKRKYCTENNIKLLEVSYKDNIQKVLTAEYFTNYKIENEK